MNQMIRRVRPAETVPVDGTENVRFGGLKQIPPEYECLACHHRFRRVGNVQHCPSCGQHRNPNVRKGRST
jgi:Zn finger protein HypA/HybF involved in hydrogenase expression